jgi:hypothetical protein
LNGVLSQVNVSAPYGFNNSLTVNTLNHEGVQVTCHTYGCRGLGMGGAGVIWNHLSSASIQLGDGADNIRVISLGEDGLNMTLTINGGGGSDSFALTGSRDGFGTFKMGTIVFLDSIGNTNVSSDGVATFIIDSCRWITIAFKLC